METIITFEDRLDNAIDEKQIGHLDRYTKITSIDGWVKLKEEFENGTVWFVIYYKDERESTESVLAAFSHISAVEIRTRTMIGNYTQEEDYTYHDGILTFKGKSILDANKNQICYTLFDLISNKQKYEETRKYYFDPVSGEELYVFWYGNNGQLSDMSSYNPIHRKYIN